MLNSVPPPLPASLQEITAPPSTWLSTLLSLVLGLFTFSAVLAVLDDLTIATVGKQYFTVFRVLAFLPLLPVGMVVFLIVAFQPGIPKRVFMTVALFVPFATVASFSLYTVFYPHVAWVSLFISWVQLLTALLCIRTLRGSMLPKWPLVPATSFHEKPFRFLHLAGVMIIGIIAVPATLVMGTLFAGKLAVRQFTDGFVDVSFSGVSTEVRDYVRDDGKKVTLVPMAHVGDSKFYEELGASFPADSIVLMEGVSDRQKLLETPANYGKLAALIGAAEQQKVFKPQGTVINADVDVSEFSPEILALLKKALLIHTKGITPETISSLLEASSSPGIEQRLNDDLIIKRNRHLLQVMNERLPETRHIIIPWGAGHMPDIAKQIQGSGFREVSKEKRIVYQF
ncbi:hypothetical protein [Brevifollis gellanilyticus]|uniref:Uncharacterized protein n=1 Tax=Brevifollis gellanilyticus TaxID=748831 RepID=A0A512M756_9BACT|nr:hypothetical protein [Brevifollis gellanilyticus]GEP42553.1 hypothetical protein BGE01nite_18440 [Brevifollis gellanilyticus]